MTNVKKKNMVAFIATAVVYLVFLLTNFSTVGCIISAFSLLYLFLSTCVSKRAAKADYGIIDNIGDYFGVSIFNLLLVSVFSMIEEGTGGALVNLIEIVKGPKFSADVLLAYVGALIVVAVAVLILTKIHKSSVKRYVNESLRTGGKLSTYIVKYILLGVASYFLLNAFVLWDVFICISVLLVYLSINIFIEKVYENNSNNKKSDTVFNWCITNILVFVLIQYMWPGYSIQFVDKLVNTAFINWSWYAPILLGLLVIGVGVYAYQLDTSDKKLAFDSKMCLALVVDLIAIPISIALYDKYIGVVYIALAIINIVFFRHNPQSTKHKENTKQLTKQMSIFVISVVVLFFSWLSFLNGSFISTALLAICITCSIMLYKHYKWVDGIWFWIFIIISSALISAASVYVSYNSTSSFIFIAVASLISIFAIIILNVKNKKQFTSNKISKTIVVVCAFLLIVFPVRNFGVDYNVEVQNKVSQADVELGAQGLDTNNIYITMTPRGKNNSIEACQYYWDDAENHDYAYFDENGTFWLAPRNGVLHVYTEDSNGVASTLTRRFCFKHLITPLRSGEIRSIEKLLYDGTESDYNITQEEYGIVESAADVLYE